MANDPMVDALEEAAQLCDERAGVIARAYPDPHSMPLYAAGAHNEAVCLAIAIRALKDQ